MKKTAILIYNNFCNFEIAPAMEMLAIAQKPVTIFARDLTPVRSEEGLTVIPEKAIDTINADEYDSLLLPGAADIREAIEDESILAFIRQFDGMPIGAISIAPILLLKAGMLSGKAFMAGVDPEELLEEGYSAAELSGMKGWSDNIADPVREGYITSGYIVTSVSYNFVRWTLAFGKLIGIDLPPKTFGIEN